MEEVFCVLTAEVFGLLTVVPGGGRLLSEHFS